MQKHTSNRSVVARKIFENFLERKLDYNEIVHHRDENILNNSSENLMLISRKMHGKLHAFLRKERALLEKSSMLNNENCWKTLRESLTTAFLETMGAKVLKIDFIGQSAAESLRVKSQEKGSETMHVTSSNPKDSEDEIVQTPTGSSGLGN